MIKVDVTISNDLLWQLQAQLLTFTGANGGKIAPATKNAFNVASKLIQKSWQNWANGGSIEGIESIKRANPRLASSIRIKKNNDFDADIYSDSPYMERIVNGTPALDMKEKYPYGTKSRVSKKGVPYLIIPFRWGTPNKDGTERAHFGNTIPLEVARIIQSRNFEKSVKTGEHHVEKNAKGENIERQEYNWGDRLKDDDLGNANGMVKMASNTGSTYFTFRVISAKSPKKSWLRNKVPPVDVINAVEKATRYDVEALLQAGFEQDLGI